MSSRETKMTYLCRCQWREEPSVSYFLTLTGDIKAQFLDFFLDSYFVKTIDKVFILSKPSWVAQELGRKEARLLFKLSKCYRLTKNQAFWKRLYHLKKELILKVLRERVETEYIIERLRGEK